MPPIERTATEGHGHLHPIPRENDKQVIIFSRFFNDIENIENNKNLSKRTRAC